MMNLCTNAGHAMANTPGILKVSLQNLDLKAEEAALYSDLAAGPYVKLSISDTGQGMDKEVRDAKKSTTFSARDSLAYHSAR